MRADPSMNFHFNLMVLSQNSALVELHSSCNTLYFFTSSARVMSVGNVGTADTKGIRCHRTHETIDFGLPFVVYVRRFTRINSLSDRAGGQH